MSYESLLIHTVGIRTYTTGADGRYGDPTITYSAPLQVPGRVEQTTQKELLEDRDTRLTWFRVFLLPTAVISALDRIEWQGRTLEVDGEPNRWYDSTELHHITAIAREIDD